MTPWTGRPVELANLLNPAFCGFLIRSAAASYTESRSEGMPFALAFLVLPLVLHMGTREALPQTVRTTLISWLQDHPEARVNFDARVRSLASYTREAVVFLMHRRLLAVAEGGALTPGDSAFTGSQAAIVRIARSTADVGACASKAQFIGRWFAQSGDAATIFALFGVRP